MGKLREKVPQPLVGKEVLRVVEGHTINYSVVWGQDIPPCQDGQEPTQREFLGEESQVTKVPRGCLF